MDAERSTLHRGKDRDPQVSPWQWVVVHWWYGVTIAAVFHFAVYFISGGEWRRLWAGRGSD
jgi:hypothetical protein